MVEKYTIDFENIIGKGTLSKVYTCKDNTRNNDKLFAVKIINIKKLTTATRNALDDELKIVSTIINNPHPNIVEFYEILKDIDNDTVYIFMEYCDSGDLRSIMKNPIQESVVQFYFSQLANGLKFLQSYNILHRDIKPANILLTNNRKVLKIADFGLAKRIDNCNIYGTICGTPMYMAPEILDQKKYTDQTDLWSIGWLLYEMLYGNHPLDVCTDIVDIRNTVKSTNIKIPPDNNTNLDVSDDCLDLLRGLLKKNITERLTWKQFFSHIWLSKYQYISITSGSGSSDSEKQMLSISVGSYGSFKRESQIITSIIIGSPVEIDIIDNFIEDKKITVEKHSEIFIMDDFI